MGTLPKTVKFMFDLIKITQTTYYWSDAATAGNLKLAFRGKAVQWLNYIMDTEQINISLWSKIEPQFNLITIFKYKQWTIYGISQNLSLRKKTIRPT
jgi:hypothetical protein